MKRLKRRFIDFSISHTHLIIACVVCLTLACGSFFPQMVIDTDPENMLEVSEPARVFHNKSKKDFALSEIIAVGIIDETNPDGVFTPQTLKDIYELTEYAKTLRWNEEGHSSGIIEADMIAPSLVDHMSQAGPSTIRFEWLMSRPPTTRAEALAVRDRALSNPLLKGQMVSEDGKALSLYLPLTDKLLSYRVYEALKEKIETFKGSAKYHIAGLPVAEGAVGVEMFKEMTIAAPLTMLVIFGLLRLFFKKWALIILPMIVATVTVVSALGLMIGFGYPVHILSSMLPIFLMPIAICDSVHVLSDFFESYTPHKGRKETIREVMNKLFMPVLYTSLTTAAGFLSFVATSIPPARVFGVFVAVGVLIAWATTIFLVPAYVMMIPEATFKDFGRAARKEEKHTRTARFLQRVGLFTFARAKLVLAGLFVLVGCAVWGILQININDNYAKRFSLSHPIRQADIALNKHFGGLYTAYLIVEGKPNAAIREKDFTILRDELQKFKKQKGLEKVVPEIEDSLQKAYTESKTIESFVGQASLILNRDMENASDEAYEKMQDLKAFLGLQKEKQRLFKRPDVLNYIASLQAHLKNSGVVGKSSSIADVVKKVNQELKSGDIKDYRIPKKFESVGECLLQYQQSHRPNDLWHMVTPDFKRTNIWLQFKTGDSTQTEKVVHAVQDYMKTHKAPVQLNVAWSGLHYVNLVFQDKMFHEMLESFFGSFLIVFCLMVVLFRSVLWGFICMVPLSLTIAAIYGVTGLVGKDYDMPVAVVSAISLGISIDFAIHFLERSRQFVRKTGSWKLAVRHMFGEPALAITRNILVVALGFLPLLVAQLVPYKTTSIMLFSILTFSGAMTLLCLSALLTVGQKWFFEKNLKK